MKKTVSTSVLSRLEKAARTASKACYAPYSKFRVGAAVLAGSGKIYSGCNVEIASYGLCNCAERTAVFTAVAAGERKITAVVVFTPTPMPSVCNSAKRIDTNLPALLGEAFGPKNLR